MAQYLVSRAEIKFFVRAINNYAKADIKILWFFPVLLYFVANSLFVEA